MSLCMNEFELVAGEQVLDQLYKLIWQEYLVVNIFNSLAVRKYNTPHDNDIADYYSESYHVQGSVAIQLYNVWSLRKHDCQLLAI